MSSRFDRWVYEDQLEVDLESTLNEYFRVSALKGMTNNEGLLKDLEIIAKRVLRSQGEDVRNKQKDIPF